MNNVADVAHNVRYQVIRTTVYISKRIRNKRDRNVKNGNLRS